MKRERFIQLLMGSGFDRNTANQFAAKYSASSTPYAEAYKDSYTVCTEHNLDITKEFAKSVVGNCCYFGGTCDYYVRQAIERFIKFIVLLNEKHMDIRAGKIIQVRGRSVDATKYIVTFEWTFGFKTCARDAKRGIEEYLTKYYKMLSPHVASVESVGSQKTSKKRGRIMENREYVTRFRYYDWADHNQGVLRGLMFGICSPHEVEESGPYMLKGHFGYFYTCKCTPAQYKRFTRAVSRYFGERHVDFDYKL